MLYLNKIIHSGVSHIVIHISVEDRKAKLIELRQCLRCTGANHYASKCSDQLTCEICGRFGHHTAFCYRGGKSSSRQPQRDRDPGVTSATGAKPPSSKTSKSSANSRGSKNSGGQMAETSQTMGVIAMNAVQKKLVRPDIPSCALATASCQVSEPGELQQLGTRIFFDSGSQCSFITRELAESLKSETFSEVRLGIDEFRSETKEDNFPVVVASVKLGSKGVQLKLLVVDDLPITISTPGIVAATNELKLADKHLDSDIVENIGIILRALHLHIFVKGHCKFREFDLIDITGGVMLQGKIPNAYQGTKGNVHSVVVLKGWCTNLAEGKGRVSC